MRTPISATAYGKLIVLATASSVLTACIPSWLDPRPDEYGRKTQTFGPFKFAENRLDHYFDLSETTQPLKTTRFLVKVTTSKTLKALKNNENDEVRVHAVLRNATGGARYLPMKLKEESFHYYEAKLSATAPDLAVGVQKTAARWRVRVEKKHYTYDDNFTITVTVEISYIPFTQ